MPADTEECPPDVTIVTLLWRNERYADSFLDSVPMGDSIERIAVANGPEAEGVVAAFDAHPRGASWKLVRLSDNRGFSGGANVGLTMAAGRIVILVNLDARFAPDFFTNLRLARDASWDIAVPSVHAWGSEFEEIIDGPVVRTWHHRHAVLAPIPAPNSALQAGTGCCFILKADVLRDRISKNGSFFDGEFHSFGEDLDFFWWADRRGLSVRYQPHLRIEHAWGGSFGGRYRYRDRSDAVKVRVMANYRLTAMKHVHSLRELAGWVGGELIALGRAIRADRVVGLRLYAASWFLFIRSALAIKRRKGHFRLSQRSP